MEYCGLELQAGVFPFDLVHCSLVLERSSSQPPPLNHTLTLDFRLSKIFGIKMKSLQCPFKIYFILFMCKFMCLVCGYMPIPF